MKMTHLENTDKRIIKISSIILILSILLNWQDGWIYNLVQKRDGNQVEVGEVTEFNNDVRIRNETAFSWQPIRKQNDVFRGDSIFTGNNSNVIILTKSGDEIVIAPNSLVVIDSKKDSISIDLAFGSFKSDVKDGKKIIVSSKNSYTELQGKDASISVSSTNGSRLLLNVVSGEVSVKSKDGKTELKSSQIADLNKNDTFLQEERHDIRLVDPADNQKVLFRPDKPISFQWISAKKLYRTRLNISRTKDMKDIVFKQEVDGNSFVTYDLPTDVQLYVQVVAEGASSDIQSFTAVGARPPIIVAPKPGFQLYFDPFIQDFSRQSIELVWQEGSPASLFEVQIAKDFDFKKTMVKQTSRMKKIVLNNLYAGDYFWRVKANDFPNQAWSEISYFSVGSEPSKMMTAPILPALNSHFFIETKLHGKTSYDIHRLTSLGAKKYILNFPRLQWSKTTGAELYELQISKSKLFKDLNLFKTTSLNYFTWKNIAPGKYFWRVRGLYNDKIKSPYSSTHELNIELTPPIITSKESIVDEVFDKQLVNASPPPIQLSWNPTVFTDKYLVDISNTEDFKITKSYVTTDSFKIVQMEKPGAFYWRIQSLDKKNKPITGYRTQKFEFQRVLKDVNSITELSTIYPRHDDSVIIVSKGKTQIDFRWTKPYKKAVYKIELASDSDFKDIIHTDQTKNNYYYLKKPITKNVFFWRVSAENGNIKTQWTNPSRFFVVYETKPFNFDKYESDIAARILAREKQNEIIAAQKRRLTQLRSPASTVDLQLDTPQMLQPFSEFVIDSNLPRQITAMNLHKQPYERFYKQIKSFPLFKWDKVPAAERYMFEIARDPHFENLIVKVPAWDPFYEWDTVRPGRYYYRLQAHNDRYKHSLYSKVHSLFVTVNRPSITSADFAVQSENEPKEYWQPPSPFVLQWTPIVFSRYYEIEFSEDKYFKITKTFKSDINEKELKVSRPGLYYWRVRGVNEFNVAISEYSSVRSIEVIQTQRTPASVKELSGLFPINRTMLFVGEGLMNLAFHWTTPDLDSKRNLASNNRFTIEIAKDAEFKKILSRTQSQRAEAIIKKDLPEGKLYWRVMANSQWSPAYHFFLRREVAPYVKDPLALYRNLINNEGEP
jgi:hypothetical protein